MCVVYLPTGRNLGLFQFSLSSSAIPRIFWGYNRWEMLWQLLCKSSYSFYWGMQLNTYRQSCLLAQENTDWFKSPTTCWHSLPITLILLWKQSMASKEKKWNLFSKIRPRRTRMDVNVPKKGAFVLLGKRQCSNIFKCSFEAGTWTPLRLLFLIMLCSHYNNATASVALNDMICLLHQLHWK